MSPEVTIFRPCRILWNPVFFESLLQNIAIMKNYIRIALRNLQRDKLHSLINIIGLAVSMAVVMLIASWIVDQCTYERYNPNYGRIARVMVNYNPNGAGPASPSTPVPLADELRSVYGGAFTNVTRSWWTQDRILAFGDKKLKRSGKFMEPGGPRLLALTMVKGDRNGLSDPGSVLLSASAARALFGDQDAIGRIMTIDEKMTASVKGVYKDLPGNSQFSDVQFIGSWQLFLDTHIFLRDAQNNWGAGMEELFVQLANKVDEHRLSTQLRNCITSHLGKKGTAGFHPEVSLEPMRRWHLYSTFTYDNNSQGLIQFVWLFGIIGGFVLVLASINYMNLSTARSERRAKEVGIRKTMGSARGLLIVQFFGEALLMSVFAFLLSLALAAIAQPFFNELAGKKIDIQWTDYRFWLAGGCFCLLTALLAGSYPALYLSSFQPAAMLNGVFRAGRGATIFRQTLVVLQFTITVILIIGTIVVFRQISFAKDRPIGYDQSSLLSFLIKNPAAIRHLPTLREELLGTGAITEMSEASTSATQDGDFYDGYSWPEKAPGATGVFSTVSVTPGYGAALGWAVIEGRDFSSDFATDSSAVLLNEAAVAFMGLKNPIGKQITCYNGRKYTILGVVRNVLTGSPYDPPVRTVYLPSDGFADYTWLLIRMKPGRPVSSTLEQIRSTFQKVIPSTFFDYQFVDQEFAKKFAAEARIGRLAAAFAIIALVISALGVFGLSSFMAEQRTREIGIRKVLGATVLQLWRLLSKEFLWLVGLSFLIGMPVAFYSMQHWLQRYPYHAGIRWWIFAGTAAGMFFITMLTISFQTIKTALANPVKSLRAE
jgi:putative ABC transport system permease protein